VYKNIPYYIIFAFNVKKMGKVNGPGKEKMESIKLDFLMNSDNLV
jgi:hypothetical protein